MEVTNIKSLSECNEAAKYLKLSDTTAEHDGKKQYNNDAPPGCYFDGGKLKFNNDLDDSGNVINTGLCTKKQWCLCNGIGVWRTLLLFCVFGRHFAAVKMILEDLPEMQCTTAFHFNMGHKYWLFNHRLD